ncbi:hypothetical protein VDG1235_4008 [Verrucomicrobiia bacterium DG1235]|nr:hypothetical protein VDG1235_4008 [Verrucomicrobiae bacterium DG1235]
MRTALALSLMVFYSGAQSFAEPKDTDHDGHDHPKKGHEDHDDHEHESHDDHDHSKYEKATLPQLLEIMEESVGELTSIASGKVSHDAEASIETLIDAAKALPSKSNGLEEKQILRVKSAIGSMQTIAMKLETALHQNNTAEAEKIAGQLGKLFELIKSQYPEAAHQDHDGHGHDH